MPPLFQCLKCGDCCRNLIRPSNFYPLSVKVKTGLGLSSGELALFRKLGCKTVESLGAGVRGRRRPRPQVILSYQLDAVTCPLLKGNRCSIYDHRPVLCRAYPLTDFTEPSVDCRFVKENRQFLATADMLSARAQVTRWALKNIEKARELGALFAFDIVARQWVRVPPQILQIDRSSIR